MSKKDDLKNKMEDLLIQVEKEIEMQKEILEEKGQELREKKLKRIKKEE